MGELYLEPPLDYHSAVNPHPPLERVEYRQRLYEYDERNAGRRSYKAFEHRYRNCFGWPIPIPSTPRWCWMQILTSYQEDLYANPPRPRKYFIAMEQFKNWARQCQTMRHTGLPLPPDAGIWVGTLIAYKDEIRDIIPVPEQAYVVRPHLINSLRALWRIFRKMWTFDWYTPGRIDMSHFWYTHDSLMHYYRDLWVVTQRIRTAQKVRLAVRA